MYKKVKISLIKSKLNEIELERNNKKYLFNLVKNQVLYYSLI
jgi:hypothetical protein